MKDRRKEERKSLMAYTQVFDLYGGLLIGYLSDLTSLGAMVIAERPHDVNTQFTLSFELPEMAEISAARMTMTARVAWCEQDISPQFYNIGFEFKEVKKDQKRIIEVIIRNYEFHRNATNYPPQPGPKRGLV